METSSYAWDGTGSIDFSTGLGLPADAFFDPLSTSLRIGGGLSAQQFDVYAAGADVALVKVRNPDGSEIAPAARTYAYIPNVVPTSIGTFPDLSGRNVRFEDGSLLVVGDGSASGTADDQANAFDFSALAAAADFLFLRDGNDTADAGAGDDRLLLNRGDDVGRGGDGGDSIYGGQGDDQVYGDTGNDLLFGDLGNDLLHAGMGNDVLFGGLGNDRFLAADGDDTLYGGGGDDWFEFSGSVGDKHVFGDKGDDAFEFDGTAGNWQVHGGAGFDGLDLRAHQGSLYLETGDGDSHVHAADVLGYLSLRGGPDRDLWEVEPGVGHRHLLETGDGDDVLHIHGPGGLQAFQIVHLGGGDDVLDLTGYAGSDRETWFLGGGDDTVFAGSGGDVHVGAGFAWVQVGPGQVRVVLDDAYLGDGSLEFEGYRPGVDGIRVTDAFGLEAVVGYRGDGLSGTSSATNWLIADDQAYTIDTFDAFLSATQADTAKPGFFTFLDGHVQTWFTFDMSSTGGAIKIADYPGLTSLPQLGLFDLGPGGDLDLLGGD